MATGETEPIAALTDSIAAELEVAAAREDRVAADCARIREALARPPTPPQIEGLRALGALLQARRGPAARPLLGLLEEAAAEAPDPWPLVVPLLSSRDDDVARRGLEAAGRLLAAGCVPLDRPTLKVLAERVEAEGSPFADPPPLARIASMLRRAAAPETGTGDPLLALYLHDPDAVIRRLAARLLDLDGEPASAALAARLLGATGHAFLDRYLRYTRATHLDLLHLVPEGVGPPTCLPSLQRAEQACGEALLREVIARLGWSRVNLGVEVERRAGVSVGGSLPLMASPAEAALLESCGATRRRGELFVIVGHGGLPVADGELDGGGPVARFRTYNLAHAEALADILDVVPLTRAKVEAILARMDGIVEHFIALFAASAEECVVLPGIYGDLRRRIVAELGREGESPQLSAELTRLVQSFEDPRTLGEVRTLHGLKRYLHQRGLRLGVRLVGAGGDTNRSVDLLLASGRRILQSVQKIAYVDFEPRTGAEIPQPVALVVDGFTRQALHGQESFPKVQVFCYGNEVHYYLSFRNHPAFLRIDYSPPLAGGMIDLEYFGVSVYELSAHPAPSLEALAAFFRRLEFDVSIEGTRVHARYDKERALDLGMLWDKAELLCGLIPYLMDLDWIVGSLDLPPEGRRAVAEAWAESFAEWGVLPLRQLLGRDRRGVLMAARSSPAEGREARWPGEGPYRDRFRVAPPPGFLDRLRGSLAALGLAVPPCLAGDSPFVIGQLRLEREVLRALREAVARGQVVETAEGLRARPADLFERAHEAEAFAGLLAAGDVAGAAQVARLVAPLERTLRFRASGRVNGYEVQHAPLALRGETLGLYVLRDSAGMIRLGLVAPGAVLCRLRQPDGSWRPNWSTNPAPLAALLRRDNYLPPGAESPVPVRADEARAVLECFAAPNPAPGPRRYPGERVLEGFRASPGRAVGTALFGTRGRRPEDFEGAILVAPAVRPEDSTFLFRAAGIVSTGGGILSHAGLIATQFRKPALIVSGEWRREADGSPALLYRTPEYGEERREIQGWPVSLYRDWREREHRLHEGDLVVLDVADGTLRVLGRDPDALALHRALALLGEASRRLARTSDDAEVLALRGRLLRATHEIEKALGRLADPAVARHAAHELLLGEAVSHGAAGAGARLLSLLLANRAVGEMSRHYVVEQTRALSETGRARAGEAARRIPASPSLYEVLAGRLEVLHVAGALESATASLRACGVEAAPPNARAGFDLDALAFRRLEELRAESLRALRGASGFSGPRTRHLLRQLERLDLVLGRPEDDVLRSARARLAQSDEAARRSLGRRRVLPSAEAGFELHPLIGWKAANLAEAGRLAGAELSPPWFAVTDRAFQQALDCPVDPRAAGAEGRASVTLREGVALLLARRDLDNAQKSARIRALWDAAALPGDLEREVAEAYRRLGDEPYVAIRSSALEEDAEAAARAGEFETFLFVRGEAQVLDQLKRAWSGLWTERAIHNRAVLDLGGARTGGGVLVQRMACSRASGVLQTVNVAEGQLREMVVNAGLGLGEGIVSGTVGADHVTVAKDGDLDRGPLRFRYVTADKREQVVFDRRRGVGTARVECLYHQRLRPALEYVELSELVRIAARLEAAYGYPLDLEFGIEGTRLFVLQVRPVPVFLSVLRETLERRPLRAPAAVPAGAG